MDTDTRMQSVIKDLNDTIASALVKAFIAGAKYWEYEKEGATMWQSDQERVALEAEKRYRGKEVATFKKGKSEG